MEYVTKGYGEVSLSSSLQRHASAGIVNSSNTFGAVLLGRDGGAANESGPATAPSPHVQNDFMMRSSNGSSGGGAVFGGCRAVSSGPAVARPMSASGSDSLYGDFLASNSGSNADSVGLVRSQSAAPSLHSAPLGPPPGLALRSSQPDSFATHLGLRRPASAGGVSFGGGGGAVRPAAKTLMDLIQEDIPPEYDQQRPLSSGPSPSVVSVTASPYELAGGRRSASPGMHQGDNYNVADMRQSSLQAQLQREQHQQQQFRVDELPGGGIPRYQQPQQLSHMVGQQQQLSVMQQQQRHVILGGAVSPGFRQGSPEEAISQASMYIQQQSPQQQHVHLHAGQQLQQQQQIFFGGQQAGGMQAQGMQPQGLQAQGLQAQVLPNGQTVYVNAGPTQQQAYGYTAVQYQSPHHQQPQIIHQQMPGGQRDQYVSVVPLQGGGQQVTYWQPNGLSQQQQTMYPGTGLVSSPGGAQIALGRLDSGQSSADSPQNYQFGGRAREKSGRGRRGTSTRGRGGDSKSASSSSVLLEEFRSTKSRDWTMRRIEGHVVEFCQDQNGSRFIQQRLEMGDVTEQQIVMKEVLPAIRRLRNDVFGNYVVQKLLDFGTPKMKADIRDTLEGEMLPLSLQMYGCRVVQKALEALDEDDLPRLLREFHHNVLSCIHDQNGNHVIQKCIEVMNSRANKAAYIGDTHRASFLSEQIDFIVDDVLANTTTLSCHPYGCRVLQRTLEHCGERKKTAILDEIKKCHKTLLDDQYGNYVIQHVLQYGREEDRDSIVQIVVESGLLGLSRQKFASNVVEKLLKYGNGDQRRAVVREMLKVSHDSRSKLYAHT
jgi:pumilio RNA-binding family